MKINGREFRLFGKKDERPLCLVLLSEKIAEDAQGHTAEIPGGEGTANEGASVTQPEGEGE